MMPRRPLFMQGTSDSPVRHPAEDVRLAMGAFYHPQGDNHIVPKAGIFWAGQQSMVTPVGTVTQGALGSALDAGKFYVYPGRALINGDSALQGSYLVVNDVLTTVTVDQAKTNPGVPAAGQFKAGLLVARIYDQLYGDTQDGWDLEVYLGPAASTAASAAMPTRPANCVIVRVFTMDSAGAITIIAGGAEYTSVRGDVLASGSTVRPPKPYQNMKIRESDTGHFRRWDFNRWVYIGTDASPWTADNAVLQRAPVVSAAAVAQVVPASNAWVRINTWAQKRVDPTVANLGADGVWTIAERGVYSILISQASAKPGISGRAGLQLVLPVGVFAYYNQLVVQNGRPAVGVDAGNTIEQQISTGPMFLEAGMLFWVSAMFTHSGGDYQQQCDHTIHFTKHPAGG